MLIPYQLTHKWPPSLKASLMIRLWFVDEHIFAQSSFGGRFFNKASTLKSYRNPIDGCNSQITAGCNERRLQNKLASRNERLQCKSNATVMRETLIEFSPVTRLFFAVDLCTTASYQKINAAKLLRCVNVNYLTRFGDRDQSWWRKWIHLWTVVPAQTVFEKQFFFLYGAISSGSPFEGKPAPSSFSELWHSAALYFPLTLCSGSGLQPRRQFLGAVE